MENQNNKQDPNRNKKSDRGSMGGGNNTGTSAKGNNYPFDGRAREGKDSADRQNRDDRSQRSDGAMTSDVDSDSDEE